jgi:hypothetical protein
MKPKYNVKTLAPTTNQRTIQGKLVPGSGEKIRLTNQPVAEEKTLLIVSSIELADARELKSEKNETVKAANSFEIIENT